MTVAEIGALFMRHARVYYRNADGSPQKEVGNFHYSLKPMRELYDHTQARDFGPLALKTVQQRMVGLGWCRSLINARMRRIKSVFKWATSEQLVPVAVFTALQTVSGLRRGKSAAPDHDSIQPVGDDLFEWTLPHCPAAMASLLRMLRLTGMRPGELSIMRPRDIDQSGPVWIYRPSAHKGTHAGRARAVFFGPKAQATLKPYLAEAGPDEYVYSPVREQAKRSAVLRASRKTKVQPSQVDRRTTNRQRAVKLRYETTTICRAVRTACEKAGLAHWHPYRLRHSFATEVRREHGLEAAQLLLGHSRADVTQVYAERDAGKALTVAAEVG